MVSCAGAAGSCYPAVGSRSPLLRRNASNGPGASSAADSVSAPIGSDAGLPRGKSAPQCCHGISQDGHAGVEMPLQIEPTQRRDLRIVLTQGATLNEWHHSRLPAMDLCRADCSFGVGGHRLDGGNRLAGI